MWTPPSLPASDKPQGKNNLPVHTLVKLHCSRPLGVHPNSIVHHRRLLFFFFLLNYKTECFTASNSITASARFFFSPPPGGDVTSHWEQQSFQFGQHGAGPSFTRSQTSFGPKWGKQAAIIPQSDGDWMFATLRLPLITSLRWAISAVSGNDSSPTGVIFISLTPINFTLLREEREENIRNDLWHTQKKKKKKETGLDATLK